MMIIDAHTHMFPQLWETKAYLEGLKVTGVDKGVVLGGVLLTVGWPPFPFLPPEYYDMCREAYRKSNKQVSTWAKESRGAIIPFCNVNPTDGEHALEELRRTVKEDGMKGLKLHPHQQSYSVMAPYVLEVLREAGALKIPVLFHDATLPWICPTEVAYMAKRSPETTIILGHSGWQEHWRKAVRAAKIADNLFCCVSGAPIIGAQSIIKAVGAERVLFGSDYPCGGAKTQLYELSKIRALDISGEEREMILGKNIIRILNL